MDARTDLLAAVTANPADDLPRLVYADWLQEHGDRPDDHARGEFIRLQVELTRLPCSHPIVDGEPYWWNAPGGRMGENGPPCRCYNLRLRERELWGNYTDSPMRAALRRETPALDRFNTIIDADRTTGSTFGVPLAVVRRGFPEEIHGPLAAFWEERECGGCRGGGQSPPISSFRVGPRCRGCSGTGRVSGPTPALVDLVSREPVVHVGLADLEPATRDEGRSGWKRAGRHPTGERYEIPDDLWHRLGDWHGNRMYKWWPNARLARAALADTILLAAKERAGLSLGRAA